MDPTEVKSVGIVGAGVAGLVTAKTLLAQGLSCTLFERESTLGGVWADGYSNFGVQVQKDLYEFPDWPLPEGTPNFTPGPVIQKYLEDYADHFGVTEHIRFNTCVDKLEPRNGADHTWSVYFSDASGAHAAAFDLVVVCIGLYSNVPNLPAFPGQEAFEGEILHISGVKSRAPLEGKRVAVLGFGKSATDVALEAAAVAQETHIIFRDPHWPVPQKLAGLIPFKWGMLSRLTSTLLPPYQRPSPVERAVHGPGKPLVWLFWRLVEILLFFQCRLGPRFGSRENLVPRKPIEVDCFGESTMLPRPAFYRLLRRGAVTAHRAEIAAYAPDGLILSNGDKLDVDLVVLGTGWRSDYGFLGESVRARLDMADDGFYLYRHMLNPELPNLVFVGSAATICSILTYSLQARWLAELLAGNHRLPDAEAMAREIADMKAWKRAWMPFSHARGARLILHMLHYHDELLRDFGANPRRKTGLFAPFKELFAPYGPSDYRSIVSGAWKEEGGRVFG
ncbi:MAG: FAD-dependent oxidoreductase [Kiloniellales bacterium]